MKSATCASLKSELLGRERALSLCFIRQQGMSNAPPLDRPFQKRQDRNPILGGVLALFLAFEERGKPPEAAGSAFYGRRSPD
jgi:hypothetical protein